VTDFVHCIINDESFIGIIDGIINIWPYLDDFIKGSVMHSKSGVEFPIISNKGPISNGTEARKNDFLFFVGQFLKGHNISSFQTFKISLSTGRLKRCTTIWIIRIRDHDSLFTVIPIGHSTVAKFQPIIRI